MLAVRFLTKYWQWFTPWVTLVVCCSHLLSGDLVALTIFGVDLVALKLTLSLLGGSRPLFRRQVQWASHHRHLLGSLLRLDPRTWDGDRHHLGAEGLGSTLGYPPR